MLYTYAMIKHSSSSPGEQDRPRSVMIVAVLQLIQSLGLLAYGAYLFTQKGIPPLEAFKEISVEEWTQLEILTSGLGYMILGLLTLVLALALWRLKRWAWLLSMSIQGIGLMVTLFSYVRQRPNYVAMLLGIALVLYLNQRDVQAAFRGRHTPGQAE